MQPLPEIAGTVGAAAGSIQMTAGVVSSGLVAVLFDGRSALSMTAVMVACSLLALIAHWLLARPAERRVDSQAVEVAAAIEGAKHS
jgi:DHA1 family bicyclomycin/chloramphenicol resistance-like MFS transporter